MGRESLSFDRASLLLFKMRTKQELQEDRRNTGEAGGSDGRWVGPRGPLPVGAPPPRSAPGEAFQPHVPTECLLQMFRSAVQSTSAILTSARPGNSFLDSSSHVGARFLQCPHLGRERRRHSGVLGPAPSPRVTAKPSPVSVGGGCQWHRNL